MSMDFKRSYRNGQPASTAGASIERHGPDEHTRECDELTVEEPLEIRLGYTFLGRPARRSISVTMRTPGADRELATGFLFGEGVICRIDQVAGFEYDGDPHTDAPTNIIRVVLAPEVEVDMASVQRNFYTTSSCGVCGKASLDALAIDDCPALDPADLVVDADLIKALPDRLRIHQPIFARTGGIHAAGLFNENGELLTIREDVGRHNALDKLVGERLLDDALPASRSILVLSGRASFELLQKALRAQCPIVVAVGAPSSLAVDLATRFGITLIGFARKERFNIYAHPDRIHSGSR